MLTATMFVLLGILTGFLATVDGQCDGAPRWIDFGNGTIGSPNFPKATYDEAISCSWTFETKKLEVLYYKMIEQKLFYKQWNGTVNVDHCAGYLKIGNSSTDCFRRMKNRCFVLYNSKMCNISSLNMFHNCKKFHHNGSEIPVNFTLDGNWGTTSNTAGGNLQNNYPKGFKMEYEYHKCPEQVITTTLATRITTPKVTLPLGKTGPTLIPGTELITTHTRRETKVPTLPTAGSSSVIIIAVPASLAFVLVLVLVLVSVMYFKRKHSSLSDATEESERVSNLYSAYDHEVSTVTIIKTPDYLTPEIGCYHDLETKVVVDNVLYDAASNRDSFSSSGSESGEIQDV